MFGVSGMKRKLILHIDGISVSIHSKNIFTKVKRVRFLPFDLYKDLMYNTVR